MLPISLCGTFYTNHQLKCATHILIQTVNKARNRQKQRTFFDVKKEESLSTIWRVFKFFNGKIMWFILIFDLLRNSRLTVPMYAYRRELLVFRAFSTVSQRVEKVFRHAGKKGAYPAPFFHQTVKNWSGWVWRREGKCEREPSGFPFAFNDPPQRSKLQNKATTNDFAILWLVKKVRQDFFDKLIIKTQGDRQVFVKQV